MRSLILVANQRLIYGVRKRCSKSFLCPREKHINKKEMYPAIRKRLVTAGETGLRAVPPLCGVVSCGTIGHQRVFS